MITLRKAENSLFSGKKKKKKVISTYFEPVIEISFGESKIFLPSKKLSFTHFTQTHNNTLCKSQVLSAMVSIGSMGAKILST